MLLFEIEITPNPGSEQIYLYCLTDDDINIEQIGNGMGQVTHITTVDLSLGIQPDIVIFKEKK